MFNPPLFIPRYVRQIAIAGLCFGFGALLQAQPHGGPELPLPEDHLPVLKAALASAVQQSPRMIARNTELIVAEANRISRRAGQLPSAGGYATYYPWTRDRVSTVMDSWRTTDRTMFNVSVTQPVFHWGALRNTTRMGELQLTVAEGQTAEAYRLLVQEIRTLYLQLIVKKASLAQTRLRLQQTVEQLALARTNLERNLIAPTALYFPETAFEQAQLVTDRAVEDYEVSKASFARLCGRPPLNEDEIPDAIPSANPPRVQPEPQLAELAASSEPNAYGLENLRRQLEIARLEHRNARVRLRPKLGVTVGLSQDEVSYYVGNLPGSRSGVLSFFTGVTVSWSIFDGFATKAAKTSTLARLRQLERTFEDSTLEAREAARSKVRQLEFSARSLSLVERSLEIQTGGYVSQKEDVTRGLMAESELQAAELGLRAAQIQAYSARADYLMRTSDLLSFLRKDPALENLPAQYR